MVSADDWTQRLGTKWVVRTSYTGSQPDHPFGEYAYETLGYRTIATIDGGRGDSVDNLLGIVVENLTEDGVATVQVRRRAGGDEERQRRLAGNGRRADDLYPRGTIPR